jgi:carbonic anhydrase
MSITDDLLANNLRWAASFDKRGLSNRPAKRVAIVACMDARFLPSHVLGVEEGDAHILRNAGGVITEDQIRSLAISQTVLGTREIILIHHTNCGLEGGENEIRSALAEAAGVEPQWRVEAFTDVDDSVRESIRRLRQSPFIVHKNVRGFVYEVETGLLREVDRGESAPRA